MAQHELSIFSGDFRQRRSTLNPDSINSWITSFSQRHDLIHLSPHAFRHTMASLLLYGNMDYVTVSKRLGHAKVSTTLDIYSHIIKEADHESAECIADIVLRHKKVI